jgi:hypothetical protein
MWPIRTTSRHIACQEMFEGEDIYKNDLEAVERNEES